MANLPVPTSKALGEETERGKAPYPVFLNDENCPNLCHLIRVASLADPDVPTTMFVRSTVWGIIASELAALPPEIFTDPLNMPGPHNFKAMTLTKNFKIVKHESDNQLLVDLANRAAAEQSHVLLRGMRFGRREEKPVDPRNVARDH